MANQTNSLSHTKWMCKYHIVFTPKYRRKIIYNQYRESFAKCKSNLNTNSKRLKHLLKHILDPKIHQRVLPV